MPIRKLPVTFDQHLGSVIDGLAKSKGGRGFLASITSWSEGTVERRVTGRTPFTVTEVELVAAALNTTVSEIVSQALRNYGGGSEQDGLNKLIREEGAPQVSETPISLKSHRDRKTPATMTEEEMEGLANAANTDPDINRDEPELP